MNNSEPEILFLTARNDITSSHLPLINAVSMGLSKPILSCKYRFSSYSVQFVFSQTAISLKPGGDSVWVEME